MFDPYFLAIVIILGLVVVAFLCYAIYLVEKDSKNNRGGKHDNR